MTADAVDDIGVELVDEVRFLEHRDEVRGREAAMRGRLPARERLDAAELPRERADDGLVVDLEEALLQRLVEVLADVVADSVALAHLLRVDGPAMVRIALDSIAGELRLIESMLEDGGAALCRVIETNAGLELDAGVLDVVGEGPAGCADARLYVAAIREHCKIVRCEAADEAAREMLAEDMRDRAQAFVAAGDAVEGVQYAEIRDVEIDGNLLQERAVLQVPLCVRDGSAEERVHARQTRQGISFIGAAARIGTDERHVVERSEVGVCSLLQRDLHAAQMADCGMVLVAIEAAGRVLGGGTARKLRKRQVVVWLQEVGEMRADFLAQLTEALALVECEGFLVGEDELLRAVRTEEEDARQTVVGGMETGFDFSCQGNGWIGSIVVSAHKNSPCVDGKVVIGLLRYLGQKPVSTPPSGSLTMSCWPSIVVRSARLCA